MSSYVAQIFTYKFYTTLRCKGCERKFNGCCLRPHAFTRGKAQLHTQFGYILARVLSKSGIVNLVCHTTGELIKCGKLYPMILDGPWALHWPICTLWYSFGPTSISSCSPASHTINPSISYSSCDARVVFELMISGLLKFVHSIASIHV